MAQPACPPLRAPGVVGSLAQCLPLLPPYPLDQLLLHKVVQGLPLPSEMRRKRWYIRSWRAIGYPASRTTSWVLAAFSLHPFVALLTCKASPPAKIALHLAGRRKFDGRSSATLGPTSIPQVSGHSSSRQHQPALWTPPRSSGHCQGFSTKCLPLDPLYGISASFQSLFSPYLGGP